MYEFLFFLEMILPSIYFRANRRLDNFDSLVMYWLMASGIKGDTDTDHVRATDGSIVRLEWVESSVLFFIRYLLRGWLWCDGILFVKLSEFSHRWHGFRWANRFGCHCKQISVFTLTKSVFKQMKVIKVTCRSGGEHAAILRLDLRRCGGYFWKITNNRKEKETEMVRD